MLPDVGATELLLIAAVALIVVGPKDLPILMRKIGQFMARMRGMAAEFRASFDEMARQSELDELRKEVQALRSGNYLSETQAAAGAHTAGIDDIVYEIDQDMRSYAEPAVDPYASEAGLQPAPAADPEPKAKPKPRKPRAKPAAEPAAAKSPAKPRALRKPKAPEAGA